MNRIFRKVFNAKRGALVAVDETRTGHSQAAGEGVCGGTHESASRSTGEKIPSGVRTLIAAAVAGVLMGGMTLPASAEDFKISGDITRLVTPLGNNDYVENFLSGWTYNVTSKTGDDGKVHNGGLQLALYNPDGTIKGNLYRDAYIQKGSTLNFLSPDTTLIGRHIYNSGNLKLASTLAFQVQDINHLGGTLEISAVGTANKLVVSADGASITGGAVHYAGGIEVKDQGGLSITGGGTTASAFTQTGGVTKVGGKTATGSLLTLEGAATVSGGEFVWLGGADSLMKITAADGFKLQGGTLTIGGEGAGSAGANWQADEKDLYASGLIQVKNGGSFLGLTDKVMEVGKGLKVVNGGRMGFDGGLRIAGGEVVQNSGSADIRASGTFEMTDGTLTLDYKDDQTTVIRGLEVTGLTQDAVISGGTINALHGRGMHFSGANAGLRITGGAFNLGATSLTSNMTDAGATGTSILITGGTFAGGEEIAGKMNYALIEGENDVRIEGKAAFADGNVRLTSSQGRVAFNLDKGTASYLNDITSLAKSLQVLGDSVVSAKNVRTTGGDGATPDIAAGASLTADAFQIQGENSVYTNAGSLSANRIVWDELGTAHQGTFVNSGTAVFGTLADQTDGSSLKLTMKGANAKLVVTDKSFVKNSAIRIEDGAKMNLRDYGLSTLGQGNDYVVENTAFNTQLKGDAQHLISASAFDGMSVLQVDRLTSEGTVTLNQGGLLKAGTVALDGTQATVHLTGGAIMTSLAGMFEGVTSSTLLVTAESPDDTADIESQYLGVSTMGNLKTGVATGIDWQSGTIAFTDASITTGVVTDAVNAIGTAAGANQGQVAVVFTGKIVGGSSTADGFTIDTLRSLEAEQKLQEGSAFISPGIILSGTTLKNSTTEGSSRPIFIVAAAESTDSKAYTSTQSIGFSKIECAIEAHVLDGKTLVLTGVERKGNDDWKADSSALLVNGSAVTGTSFSSRGFISAENGGTIQLGTPGLAWKTAGNVGEIAIAGDGSALSVVNGEFGTVKLGLGKGASATIRDTGTLHVDRYMTVEGASMTVAGAFIHESSAQAGDELLGRHETNGASASSTFQDLTVGSTGLLKVDGKGAEKGEVLKLLAGAQHEVISGTSEWKELKTAQGAVTTIGASGTLKLTSDPTPETGDFAGTIVNSGRFETAQESPIHTGTFTNKGVHTATNGVGAFFQDLNIIGGTHLNDAGAYEEGGDLAVDSKASWTNKGEAHWNAVAVMAASGSNSGKLVIGSKGFKIGLGTFENTGAGTVDVTAGKTSVSGGEVQNAASWTAGEVEQSGGEFAIKQGGATKLTTLALSGGTWKNSGSVTGKTLTLTGEGVWENEAYEGGRGTETWNAVAASGTMTNSGLLTVGSDAQAGTFTALGGTVSNQGEMNLTHVETALYSGAAVTNGAPEAKTDAVKALYNNLTITAGSSVNHAYEKGHILTVKDGGTWTNNHIAIWDQVGVENDKAQNNGTLTLAKTDAENALVIGKTGVLTGNGSISGEGVKVLVEGALAQNQVTVGTLANKAGTIALGTLTNFGTDNTYVHDGASGKVSAADDSVFSGTNLVFTGGGDIHIDATTVGGAADFGGLRDGSGLGANNVVIKGGSNYVLGTQVGDSANTAAYNGMTTVYVKTLKDETTLDIQEGGRLVTEGLALTGTQKSTKLNGGVLTTGLASLFSTIANKYISLDATDPESGKVDVNSHILTVDSIGSIKSTVAAGIDFVKGAIGFNDSAVSLSVVNSVADAIRTAAGASASDIDVVFDGRITNSAGVVGSLTYTDLEDLFTEQGEIPGSPVTSPGIIIGGLDLDASGDADGIVSFGAPDSSSDVKGPVGFKKVTGAEGVNAIDGRGALLGNELAGAIGSAPFNWTDDNRLIETGTAGKGGTVEVGANGRFDFGSKGTEKPHTGWVDSVNAAGTFKVQNGEYGVKGDLVSSGTTVVDTDALLHTGGITAEKGADAAVRGTIILDAADGSQKITSEAGSVITVSTSTGRLDANGKDASLAGTVHTQEGGTSLWHDMTVAVGGLNHVGNGGTETGRYLTIEEGAQNAWVVDAGGKSTWDKVTNASGSNAGETIVGTGTKTEGELADKSASEFNVAVGGSYENTGRLDLTKAGNTVSDGAISTGSKGETLYDDLTVGANGSDTVKAGGSEKGDILDLTDASQKGWVVEAGGNSVWNEVIGAKGENSGTVTVGTGEKKDGELADTADSQFNVAADDAYTNNGTTDLTKAGNVSVDGRLDTGAAGETKFDDKTIGETGSSTVAGKESGDILDLTHGGREVVEETGSITWNQILVGGNDAENPGSGILDNKGTTQVGKLVVEAGGQIRNDGKLTGDELTVGKGGVIEMTGGESDFKKTVAESGSVIVIGNGKDLSPDNKVAVNLDFGSADNPVNGSIFVIGNGELNLGSDLGFDDAIKAPQLPDSASKLIVGKTVHVGNTGSLIVGKDTWTSSTDDAAGKANVAHGNGNLIFAKDSFTVIDVPGVGHGPAFKTESSGKTVTVEDGATLILGNVTESGDYVITDGFAVGSGPAGWLDEDHLYALSDGTGLDWILSLKTNPNQIIVNAAYSDIRTLYPDIVIPDTVNDALKHSGDDARGAADTVLTEILKDKDGTVSGKTRTVNTLAQIAQAGGVFANNQDAMTSALNAVESRTSFTGDVFNASGVMAGSEKPTDLWAQLLTSTRTADNQKSAGRMTGGYDADVTGVMAGLDHRIDGTQWRAGAALSYQKADIDSTGDWDAVSTDAETFGVQAYAHFSPSGYFNLIGSVGYFHSSSDVDMNLPWATKSFRKASANVSTDMVAAGLRAEGRFAVTDNIALIPHAGVRFLTQSSGAYDTKVDGAKAFSTKAESSTTGQVPVGLAVRGDFDTAAGWSVKPWGDVSVMPQFGETQTRTTVTAHGVGIPESMTGDMTGHFAASGSLGVIAEKGAFSAAASYGYTGGSDGRGDHAASVTVRYRF